MKKNDIIFPFNFKNIKCIFKIILFFAFSQYIFFPVSTFANNESKLMLAQNDKKFDTGQNPKEEITEAETILFLDNHLEKNKLPLILKYKLIGKGSILKNYEQEIIFKIKKDKSGTIATGKLKKNNKLETLDSIKNPTSNPIILHFLEKDILEMKRLTGGQPNYFRKRIRAALAEGPKPIISQQEFNGKKISITEFTIRPYKTDPLRFSPGRGKYKKYSKKKYKFKMSDEIPGKVVEIVTQIPKRTKKNKPLEFYSVESISFFK